MSGFIVEGIDCADGSRTELHSCDNSGDARAWMRRYVSAGDAGGWDLVEVYDVRSDPERLFYWERGESDFPGGHGA
jgi:hypothetical protein